MMRLMKNGRCERCLDKIFELPNFPPGTLDRAFLVLGHHVHDDVRRERDGIVCESLADADVVVVCKCKAKLVVEYSSAEARHVGCVAQLERRIHVKAVAAILPRALQISPAGMRSTIEPMNSTGRATPLETLTRNHGNVDAQPCRGSAA
eukprot:2359649-Pleurochrysis_carterae.AAC.3